MFAHAPGHHDKKKLTCILKCDVRLLDKGTADLSLIQQEVVALEELSRQLFLETVDLQATKVQDFGYINKCNMLCIMSCTLTPSMVFVQRTLFTFTLRHVLKGSILHLTLSFLCVIRNG